MIRVGVKLSVSDDADKNVNFPLCELKENVFSHETKHMLLFTKIDPSKEGWGNDLKVEVNAKPGKTTQYSSNTGGWGGSSGGYSNYSGGGGYTGGGYYSGGTGIGSGTQFYSNNNYLYEND